jgi:hypothetical protein
MTFRGMKIDRRAGSLLGAGLLFLMACLSSKANVYATDIKINGFTNNAAMTAGQVLQISYILNEPATGGVTVQIQSNTTPLWNVYLAGGTAGTAAGSNSVAWAGTNQEGANAAAGVYNISITAAATGYPGWTNITDDGAAFQLDVPMSIAVNKNSNSPFCGRVFVGSAPSPSVHGVTFAPGIAKYNADGSPPDEGGGLSTGGYPWAGRYFSPWKISIAGDDKVYIDDWGDGGIVLAFDEVISTNYLTVLGTNNYSYPDQQLSGPWVTGSGNNTLLLMADANTNMADGLSAGIVQWGVTNNGMLGPNDTGTVLVGISSNTNGLTIAPWDMALGTNGNIYVIQNLDGVTDPGYAGVPRLFCFPPYSGTTETNALWSIGSTNEDLERPYGIAVDPTATFVAVAVFGYGTSADNLSNGGVSIYYATNGQLVTQLDTTNGLAYPPEYTDVAWDSVGNLYATDYGNSFWRAYSPPGPNQATTLAVPVIQIYDALARPFLSTPQVFAGQFTFTLQGQSNVTYFIEASSDLVTWTNLATNYDTAAVRSISVPAADAQAFYQAVTP